MDKVLYRKIVRPAALSPDGETPSEVVLTQEVNCYVLWYQSHEGSRCLGVQLIGGPRHDPSRMIEKAVEHGALSPDALECYGLAV